MESSPTTAKNQAGSIASDTIRRGAIQANDVSYSFGPNPAVRRVSLSIMPGEKVALVGPSGCGKSTLLYLLAGLIVPDSGSVSFGNINLSALARDKRAHERLTNFGFVFQFAELLPELTLRENAELPARMMKDLRALAEVSSLLGRLGIADVSDHLPSRASGGQRQRTAIARAVAHRPAVIFADEPTGALDRHAGLQALAELAGAVDELGSALLVVTHDPTVAEAMDRTIVMEDGSVMDRGRN